MKSKPNTKLKYVDVSSCGRKLFIFFINLITVFFCFDVAAGTNKADSLKLVLSKTQDDTARTDLLIKIAKNYRADFEKRSFDSIDLYVQKAFTLSQQIKYKKAEADVLLMKGKIELARSRHYDSATLFLLQSLTIYDSLHNKNGIANCNLQLGVLSFSLQSYSNALAYFQKAIQYSSDNSSFNATAHYLIALSYSEMGDIKNAIPMFDLALTEFTKNKDVTGILECKEFIGKMYSNSGNYQKAIDHLTNVVEEYRVKVDSVELVPCFAFLATACLKNGDPKNAIKYGTASYKFGNAEGAVLYLKEALNTLFISYNLTGDTKNAFFYLDKLNSLKDSIYSNTIMQRITELNSRHEYIQQLNAEKAAQEKKDALAKKELQKQKIVRDGFIGGFAIVLFFATIFFRQRNKIKKGNEALRIAKEKAEKSEKFKQQFLANMSHEIRTPMNAVMGMTDLVLASPLNEKQKFYLDGIKKSSDTLLHIINDILDLSKIEAGKIELEKIDFSILELVEHIRQMLQQKATYKGLHLMTHVDKNVSEILIGDPVRINQVLMNLAGNAVKFTEHGSVTIEVLKGAQENEILFSIIDTGIGIPKDKLESVFESFTQAHSSDTRKFGGTGLGLTISKQLVELMGGKIFIESEFMTGSKFSFIINCPEGSAERIKKLKEINEIDGSILNGLKILLVDDNEFNRTVAHDTLKACADIEISEAHNGREVLEILKQQDFDVILMDVQMPVMDGYEATQIIRKEFPFPKNQTPVIALTASVVRSDLEKCRIAGMNDYVPKPFRNVHLISAIARAAGREIKNETPGSEMFFKTDNQDSEVQ